MPSFEEVLTLARQLPAADQQQLARELGAAARPTLAQLGELSVRPPAPHSVAWVKAERGHAVLATDTGASEANIPAGPEAVAGMWSDMQGGQE